MTRKIKLSKKDAFLVAFGILISFMIQSVSDAVRNGMEFFNYSKTSIFEGSIISAVAFVILTLVFLNTIDDKDKS